MPIRIPTHTIVVTREGKRVSPKIGEPFEFTADEVKEISAVSKDALRKVERVVEDDDATGTDLEALTVPKLKAYAAEKQIDLGDASSKADILAAIKAAEGAEEL